MFKLHYLFILLFFQSVSFATKSIAISDIIALGFNESEIAALTDVLRSELSKTGKFEVMERSQVETILKEQGFQQSGACNTTDCAIEIGQLLAVNFMIISRIGKIGDTYTLSIKLVNIETGKIEKDIIEKQKGNLNDLLDESIPLATQKLSGTKNQKTSKRKGGIIVGVTLTLTTAITIPVILYLSQNNNDNPETAEVNIEW